MSTPDESEINEPTVIESPRVHSVEKELDAVLHFLVAGRISSHTQGVDVIFGRDTNGQFYPSLDQRNPTVYDPLPHKDSSLHQLMRSNGYPIIIVDLPNRIQIKIVSIEIPFGGNSNGSANTLNSYLQCMSSETKLVIGVHMTREESKFVKIRIIGGTPQEPLYAPGKFEKKYVAESYSLYLEFSSENVGIRLKKLLQRPQTRQIAYDYLVRMFSNHKNEM